MHRQIQFAMKSPFFNPSIKHDLPVTGWNMLQNTLYEFECDLKVEEDVIFRLARKLRLTSIYVEIWAIRYAIISLKGPPFYNKKIPRIAAERDRPNIWVPTWKK